MHTILVKLFIRDSENTKDIRVRTAYGTLGSVTGIVVNLILAVAKYIAGVISGSISVTADAINNLSDAGSSIVSLFGVKLSAKPADKGHPYGHGRIEYISASIVAFLVLLMGVELLKSSIEKIANPVPVQFNWVSLIILVLSILAKLWLGLFNKRLGKKIKSAPVERDVHILAHGRRNRMKPPTMYIPMPTAALCEAQRRFTIQQCADMMLIAAHEAFGFGPERLRRLMETYQTVFDEYADMALEDGQTDKDIEYTKGKLDRALKSICGDWFVPWEERYG